MGRSSREMTLYTKATDAYLRDLEASGASPLTVRARAYKYNRFYEFMIENGYSCEGPTTHVVAAYKIYLADSGISQPTIRNYLAELKAFFDWASDASVGDPFYSACPITRRMIPSDKNSTKIPYNKLLTPDEVLKLVQNNGGTKNWVRNYAIVIMILTTAIRNAELLHLTLRDLNFKTGYLTVRNGKGGKSRTIPFPLLAQEAVKDYLAAGYRPADAPDDAVLFGTYADSSGLKGGAEWHAGCTNWLSNLIERHVRTVTGHAGIKSHALRHSFAQMLLERGVPTEEIQAILGHEKITTTQIYTGRLSPDTAGKHATAIMDEIRYQARKTAALAGRD